MHSCNTRTRFNETSGFTLIELLITIAIILLITTIVVVQYGAFNSTVLLKSQAYEVALNLREAQVFSISVRGENNAFRHAYGLYFTTTMPNTYQLFLDTNDNDRYDSGEALGQAFTVDSRFSISGLSIGSSCGTTVENLSVTFRRPDFDAYITSSGGSLQTAACVILSSASGEESRSVYVSTTGQISVQTAP